MKTHKCSERGVFTSIIARGLERCQPDLTHLDQTGFIKQRQMQNNVRGKLHRIRQVTENNVESALLSLDAHKAFDAGRWVNLPSRKISLKLFAEGDRMMSRSGRNYRAGND